MIYRGACHCGAVRAEYETQAPVRLRHDGCSFCASRGVKSASDAKGSLRIEADGRLIRYRFGHRTADFLICPACGTYVATYMEGPRGPVGVINVVGLAVPELKPVLSLRTCIAQLRTIQPGHRVSYNGTFTAARLSRIAVLPIGYADGWSRHLSNRGRVLVRGRRVPIVGLVCMDMVMVDVTDIPGVTVGDDVVLIGRQGEEQITAQDLADWTGTIPYEILCSIGPRIPRRYLSS